MIKSCEIVSFFPTNSLSISPSRNKMCDTSTPNDKPYSSVLVARIFMCFI